MGCLTRKKIYTNAHRLYQNRNTAFEMEIPCGNCSECRKAKANEWRARTYYEYIDCIKKGGFALWDRLSYDNENLPHLQQLENNVPDDLDFTCFNREDIQSFMKRLRSNLEYEGYKPEDNIRYLIAAEYGQEEGQYMSDKGYLREGTLRPHYHGIFYCTDKSINPAKLSMHIKKAWGKGTTNGIEDNPVYFGEKGVIKTKADAITISDYIGKYCLKNQTFDKVANYKITELIRHYRAAETGKDYEKIEDKELKLKINRERIQACKRRVGTFHLQSKSYGAAAQNDKRAMEREGLLGMPDKEKIYWYQALPMYYQRKIYYDHIRTKEGKVIWYLNKKGLDWKIRTFEKRIEKTAKKFEELTTHAADQNFLTLIENYNLDNKITIQPKKEWERIRMLTAAYRNGRTWKHFAEYILFHRGRIWNGQKPEPWQTIMMNYNTAKTAENEEKEPLYYNYNHTTDKDHFGRKMIGHEDLGDKWKGYRKPYGDEMRQEDFAKIYTANESSCEEWENYDKLKDILDQIQVYIEWNNSERDRRREQTELTWKGIQKTLYKNIIS